MVYLKENIDVSYFPRTTLYTVTDIELENQITHKTNTFNVTDISINNNFYAINTSNIKSNITYGQYDYTILNNGDETGDYGILQYGDYYANSNHYDNNCNIIQYNP